MRINSNFKPFKFYRARARIPHHGQQHDASKDWRNPKRLFKFPSIFASISFVTSLLGLSFQVFVLYPWHEELSYEFKTLEEAIIRLDRTLESPTPSLTEEQVKRPTDKYTHKPNAKEAGPKISDYIKILSDEDEALIKGAKQ